MSRAESTTVRIPRETLVECAAAWRLVLERQGLVKTRGAK